ncbi:hypothetical protein ABW20_dc0106245 [Dactylellina cionopaga]|nr:hypothetical protein ABW20_dc0106245 [Dactylellina cionopaga]
MASLAIIDSLKTETAEPAPEATGKPPVALPVALPVELEGIASIAEPKGNQIQFLRNGDIENETSVQVLLEQAHQQHTPESLGASKKDIKAAPPREQKEQVRMPSFAEFIREISSPYYNRPSSIIAGYDERSINVELHIHNRQALARNDLVLRKNQQSLLALHTLLNPPMTVAKRFRHASNTSPDWESRNLISMALRATEIALESNARAYRTNEGLLNPLESDPLNYDIKLVEREFGDLPINFRPELAASALVRLSKLDGEMNDDASPTPSYDSSSLPSSSASNCSMGVVREGNGHQENVTESNGRTQENEYSVSEHLNGSAEGNLVSEIKNTVDFKTEPELDVDITMKEEEAVSTNSDKNNKSARKSPTKVTKSYREGARRSSRLRK